MAGRKHRGRHFSPLHLGKPNGGEKRRSTRRREEDIATYASKRCLDDCPAEPMTPMFREHDNRTQQVIAGASFEAGISDRLAVAEDGFEEGAAFVFNVIGREIRRTERFAETSVATGDFVQCDRAQHGFAPGAQHGVSSAIRGAQNSVDPPQQSFSRNSVRSRRPSRSAR